MIARLEGGLALGHLFAVVGLALGVEALLHLAFDLGLAFRFESVFLAGTDAEGEGGEERK